MTGIAWLDWAKAIFDLVKGIAWPLALFLVIWLFKEEIRKLIPRIKSVSKDGVTLEPDEQPSAKGKVGQLEEPDHPLLTVKPVEELLAHSVEELKEEAKIPRLIRALAVSQLERRFENLFSWIFQSQIDFLRMLDDVGLPEQTVATYYRDVVQPLSKERYGDFSAEDWLKFLFDQELIARRDGNIWRTDYGTDFLRFIQAHKSQIPRLP